MMYWERIEWLASYLSCMDIGNTLTVPSKLGMATFNCVALGNSKMFTIDIGDTHLRSRYPITAARLIYK